MATLAAFVHVTGKDGRTEWFGPDDTVPKWAADQISNPSAWAGASEVGQSDYPEGDPSEDWTHAQLDAYAEAQEPAVDVSGATNKAEKVAALTAASA